jgi:hypothetical protein
MSCAPYVCGPDACRTTCAAPSDCLPGYSCLGGSCTDLAANGVSCTTHADCISGHCTEGFCCGSAACPACNSCAVPGHEGTCSPAGDGTACAAASCDGNERLKPTATCAAGQCVMPARIECAPYGCDAAANACKTSCTVDGDCAKKSKCTPGAAGAPGVCSL